MPRPSDSPVSALDAPALLHGTPLLGSQFSSHQSWAHRQGPFGSCTGSSHKGRRAGPAFACAAKGGLAGPVGGQTAELSLLPQTCAWRHSCVCMCACVRACEYGRVHSCQACASVSSHKANALWTQRGQSPDLSPQARVRLSSHPGEPQLCGFPSRETLQMGFSTGVLSTFCTLPPRTSRSAHGTPMGVCLRGAAGLQG